MKYLVNTQTKEHIRYNDDKMSPVGIWKIVEADADGWISWNGGECPLPDDCEFQYRYRNEGVSSSKWASGLRWAHINLGGDIVSYRPILAEKEEVVCEMQPASVFDRLRQATEAAESIPAILAEINALLPDWYCVTKREAEQPAEDMADWRNWKEGDLVECISIMDDGFGRLYNIKVGDILPIELASNIGVRTVVGSWGKTGAYRFHSRPVKS